MRTFDFYEFVGVLVPGAVALIITQVLFGSVLSGQTLPQNLGSLGVYIILAYFIGHLIQGLARGVEVIYWYLWKGMPTDWPVTRPAWKGGTGAISGVSKMTGKQLPEEGDEKMRLLAWQAMVRQARSTIYAIGRATRVQIFNSNYGMFRALLTLLLLAAVAARWATEVKPAVAMWTLLVLAALAERRMHRFGTHYATELFANAAAVGEAQSPTFVAGDRTDAQESSDSASEQGQGG